MHQRNIEGTLAAEAVELAELARPALRLVKRTLFAAVPPRVDYELTALGRTLVKPIRALLDWTIENRAAMAESRLAYATASKKTD